MFGHLEVNLDSRICKFWTCNVQKFVKLPKKIITNLNFLCNFVDGVRSGHQSRREGHTEEFFECLQLDTFLADTYGRRKQLCLHLIENLKWFVYSGSVFCWAICHEQFVSLLSTWTASFSPSPCKAQTHTHTHSREKTVCLCVCALVLAFYF